MLGFNYKKAVQALNLFANLEGGSINKMKALKLIWLSDRLHLRKYGRPILNDNYVAMPFGPVASSTKDLAENTSFLSDQEQDYRNKFITLDARYTYKSISGVDQKVFSKTDLDAMKAIYEAFGKTGEFVLSEESHKYPEWQRFETHLKSGSGSRYPMDYNDFFKSSEENHFIFTQDDEYLNLSKEMFLENGYIYQLI